MRTRVPRQADRRIILLVSNGVQFASPPEIGDPWPRTLQIINGDDIECQRPQTKTIRRCMTHGWIDHLPGQGWYVTKAGDRALGTGRRTLTLSEARRYR